MLMIFWPAIPGDHVVGEWLVEDHWEVEDPLWRTALELKPSLYIEDLDKAGKAGKEDILNIEFENSHMFHTIFIHGHAHCPPISEVSDVGQFYGSVQAAVFDGPRVWPPELRELLEACLVKIAPVMEAYGETAPGPESFKK